MKNQSFSPNEIKSYRVTKKEDIKASNEEILEEWKCKICDSLVYEPKICTVCNHAFCNECIKKFIQSQNKYKCIYKCANSNIREMNRMDKSYIDNIKLRCQHKGCNHFIKYNDYKDHLEKCKYRLYHCKNKPCKVEGILSVIKEHSKHCQYRIVSCYKCNMTYRFNNLNNHLKVCPQQPVKCDFCEKIMIRNEFLTIHHSENAKCLKSDFNKIKTENEELKKLIEELKKTIEEKENIISKQNKEINILKESRKNLDKNNEKIKEIKESLDNILNKNNKNINTTIKNQENDNIENITIVKDININIKTFKAKNYKNDQNIIINKIINNNIKASKERNYKNNENIKINKVINMQFNMSVH